MCPPLSWQSGPGIGGMPGVQEVHRADGHMCKEPEVRVQVHGKSFRSVARNSKPNLYEESKIGCVED